MPNKCNVLFHSFINRKRSRVHNDMNTALLMLRKTVLHKTQCYVIILY